MPAQIGVHGVLLRTNSPADVRALAKAVEAMQLASTPPLVLERATVTHVTPTGMGEVAEGHSPTPVYYTTHIAYTSCVDDMLLASITCATTSVNRSCDMSNS